MARHSDSGASLDEQSRPLYADVDIHEDEKPHNFEAEHRTLQRTVRRLRRWLVILAVAFITACVAVLFSAWRTNATGLMSKGHLSPVPSIPLTQITFERDDRFAAPSTPEADEAWGSMMPDGDGFITVHDSKQYGLPPGKQTAQGELYDISLFHQLHCLKHLRTYAFTLKATVGRNNSQEIFDKLLAKGEDHVYHCFDYIRQALMCAGDMTVEWPREEADGSRFAVDGWGITHECKSWEAIVKYMNEQAPVW